MEVPWTGSRIADEQRDEEAQTKADQLDTRLTHESFFCDKDAFEAIEWKTVDAIQRDAEGNIIFEQKNVEAPKSWSDRAIRIVAQKYFRGRLGEPQREHSVRQIVKRVVDTIAKWAAKQRYFQTAEDVKAFRNDLATLLLTQRGSFNSPVWFNLGADVPQQCSACFIQSVEDNMESIAALQQGETMIFKRGSGSGTNFSALRSCKETLSGGGVPSGPVSFMRGLDAWAGIIKSGGTTRRAAKMAILNVDHPDIREFIGSKQAEEAKAHALIKEGYSSHFDDAQGAYASVFFQNVNHSVRVDDDFMRAVERAQAHPDEDVHWPLRSVTTNKTLEKVPVLEIWNQICEAAHHCGDPGLQFDDLINHWHTCAGDGRINGSNPCSEFMFLDDTSCNLASLNLYKFKRKDGELDVGALQRAVTTFIIAQDVLVDNAHYPTERITTETKKYRALGLGYTNLGAYLMSKGLAYDSQEGRREAQEITSLMTAWAYHTSARLAAAVGPFERYADNQKSMLKVLKQHDDAAQEHSLAFRDAWTDTCALGREYGFRNAQVTLLAPTGTISFMMDCDTTGCEPETSLYKIKHLVGGGTLVMENRVVEQSLKVLGYDQAHRKELIRFLGEHKTLEGAPIKKEHLPVFDCAIPAAGTRRLGLSAHINMVAAIQPFLSGAISKTMNVHHDASVDDVSAAFMSAWTKGLKSITIYRDGCKQSQPIDTQRQKEPEAPKAVRRRLKDHQTNVHRIKFKFGEVKGYLLVTPYEDTGMPGEIFVEWAKEGSTVSGLVDGWAQSISYNLQYGVPLEALVRKFAHTKFEPSGFSPDHDIRHASSIYDALMRKLAAVFLNERVTNGHATPLKQAVETAIDTPKEDTYENPPCLVCGSILVRNGAGCFVCSQCGTTTGCS
jgi:ribonucleoside-diphosphate reductase alpha chain